MGRFSKFVSAETKAKSSTISVNKYEIPENALEIMAKICSPKNEDRNGQYFREFMDIIWPDNGDAFKDFLEGDGDYKFWRLFTDEVNDLFTSLDSHNNTNATQVVVAGAYSSGKSTFLNTMLGHNGLLPTGVEPVSIVNTFIYCTKGTNQVNVKGVNQKNVLVQLDTDVLQCIQHASKSKVYLASVLDKLIIEYPANDLTAGLSFIDTPGYNKSDKKNDTNGRTDEETMRQALGKGDVLFWIVDSEDGTVGETGCQMINNFLEEHENGKVLIVFNKSDKKGSDIKNVLNDAARKFKVGQDSHYIDVIGFSSTDKAFQSFKGYNSLEDVFQQVRNCSSGYSEVQQIMNHIKWLFDNRIEWHENEKKEWNDALMKSKTEKNEIYEFLNNAKEDHKTDIDWISKIILDSYSGVQKAADDTYAVANKFHSEVFDVVQKLFNTGSAQMFEGDAYDSAVNKACNVIDGFMDKLNNACNYRYYKEENRQAALNSIKEKYDNSLKRYQNWYDEICSDIDRQQKGVDTENAYIALWQDYKDRIVAALERGISIANNEKKRRGTIKASVQSEKPLNIFEAIINCDYNHFENCFTKGVSLNDFNPEGYSPLTYAVKTGQNDMVQFFIDHNADLKAYDKRGYNSIQTAVENNFKDICQMLLDADNSLSNIRSAKGEDLMTIAKKNPFENWLKNNI